MEKIIKMKKSKSPVLLIIVVAVVALALAVGIYYLVNNNRDKEPSRGTYVIEQKREGYSFEKANK